jgi:hypothetical protein
MTPLTVVIATHRRAALLARTLESIARAEPLPGKWHVLVVENGPRAGAAEVVERFADRLPISYRHIPAASKSRALNLAIAESDTPLLVFTDDDVRVARRWLVGYAEAAARLGRGHYFCGPNDPDYQQKPPAWLLAHVPSCVAGLQFGPVERPLGSGELGLGANWAAWREDVRTAGGFDPALGPGPRHALLCEEDQVQRALLARGVVGMWVPAAGVHHWVPTSGCTPRWALARAVRGAMTRAWLEPVDPQVPLVFGAPRYLWRKLAESVVGWAVATGRAAPVPERFRAGMRAASAWGLIQGHRRRTAATQDPAVSLTQRVTPATIPLE